MNDKDVNVIDENIINEQPRTFQHDGYTLTEIISQPYANGSISAGFVLDHPEDSLYVQFEREGDKAGMFLALRPDELAALLWCSSGLMWSLEIARLEDPENKPRIQLEPSA